MFGHRPVCWLCARVSRAHSQGTLDELRTNMQEVVEMLPEDGEPELEAEFIGTEIVKVALR